MANFVLKNFNFNILPKKVSAEFAAKSSAIDHNRTEQACTREIQPRSEAAVTLLFSRQLN